MHLFGLKTVKGKFMSAIVPKGSRSGSLLNSIKAVARTTTFDVWDDFLKLQISDNTKRTYASALDDFFTKLTGEAASVPQIQEFLGLSEHEAVGVDLNIRGYYWMMLWHLRRLTRGCRR